MSVEKSIHLGFTANGEDFRDNGFDNSDVESRQEDSGEDKNYAHGACTILRWNGEYQKPNITITGSEIYVSLGRNVTKIQLRHVSSGGIRYYVSGAFNIPNGEYVLSLFGSTYPHEYIKACVNYS